MPLPIGSKFGPYEIVAPIGAGGMGEVYRARDTRLGREVAIKVLPESFSRDAERLRRFEQEARSVAALNHPNILAIHDIGESGGAPFLVSELLEGHSLRKELDSGPVPTRRAVDYGTQLANGLAAAHDKGVVHRDLKPENVFVCADGRIKILDFGLAKLAKPAISAEDGVTQAASMQETTPGIVLGTVGYMSPEQVRGEPADARSDIFALGTILYEMFSGQRAFRRDTSAETMTAILKEDPPEITTAGKPIAPALERIVRRCLEKKPLQRFQSARDLAFNLEGLSGSQSTSAASAALASAASEKEKSRKWLLPAAAALLLLLAGAAAGWLLHRSGSGAVQTYQQLTFDRGLVYSARFGADGRTIYYSANWNGQPLQIYSTDPDSPESRPLNLLNSSLFAVTASQMAISQGCQDRFIGACQGTLATVPIAGGAPRPLAEDALGAEWTADGSEMAVIRQVNGKYRLEFPRGTVLFESPHWLSYMRISPNGKYIALAQMSSVDGDAGGLVVVDRAGKIILSTQKFVSFEGLAWSPSGDEVWVGTTPTHAGWADTIVGITLSGKQRDVYRVPGMLRLHDVTRDGRVLFSRESWRTATLFRGPHDTKDRDLSWLDYAVARDISADGSMIAFDDWGAAAGSSSLAYVRKTDGSPAVKLGTWWWPVLSPDGRWVFAQNGATVANSDFYLIPVGAGETRPLGATKLVQTAALGWMPDGKNVYFVANLGDGWRVWLSDLTGGAPRSVTPLVTPRQAYTETHLVSPDAKMVFARDANSKAMLYPLDGGEPRAIPGWQPEDIWITWTADGKSAYIFRDEKNSAPVYRLDLQTGKRELVTTISVSDLAGVTSIQAVRMTPDGKSYAYSYSREQSDLFVVEGVR